MRETPGPYATVPRLTIGELHLERACYEPGDYTSKCDMPWKCMCTDCVADRNERHAPGRRRSNQRARRIRRLNEDHRHRRKTTGARRG
jgi:hypothetical protein